MKATLSMISAVKAVQKSQRLQAAALAEQTFHRCTETVDIQGGMEEGPS